MSHRLDFTEMKSNVDSSPRIEPRLILHGGAGNISRATLTPERRRAFRAALSEIVCTITINRTNAFMTTPKKTPKAGSAEPLLLPSALETATFALVLFEDCPLFNCAHGAVFTRDGINELEASVMVSRGHAKRGVGVMGLRRVRNPILLARHMLEHGDADLAPRAGANSVGSDGVNIDAGAQGHTQLYGAAAEALAVGYGLPLVDPSYFFTQGRWDEHVRALERERAFASSSSVTVSATWAADEYLPQGTCGAAALDADGVVCCATSTGGLTNKLTGRIGDTPVVGAGSWAGSWTEVGDPSAARSATAPVVELSRSLCRFLADCLPVPMQMLQYTQLQSSAACTTTTRSIALSGTGNGDSFLRVSAAHTVAAMAQYKPVSSAVAVSAVAGPGGILQESAGDRWGLTGEGEGGFIGVEAAIVRDDQNGSVWKVRSRVVQDFNCGGMFRAWIDDDGEAKVRIFRND